MSLTFRQLSTLNNRGFAIGTAASSPATYGALHGPLTQPLSDSTPLRVSVHPGGGGYDVSLGQSIAAGNTSWVVGEHVYACLFAVDPPISGSVPDLVIDLGVLS